MVDLNLMKLNVKPKQVSKPDAMPILALKLEWLPVL